MRKAQLIVCRKSASATKGFVYFGPFRWPCALGRTGIRAIKREGDGATPRGHHRLLFGYFRPDQGRRSPSAIALIAIRPGMGWCDAPADANYNREIEHPYPASAEHLWRQDRLYDLVVVTGYNVKPRSRQRGSAIFLHVARPDFAPTEGCIAMRRQDLQRLLSVIRTPAEIVIL